MRRKYLAEEELPFAEEEQSLAEEEVSWAEDEQSSATRNCLLRRRISNGGTVFCGGGISKEELPLVEEEQS